MYEIGDLVKIEHKNHRTLAGKITDILTRSKAGSPIYYVIEVPRLGKVAEKIENVKKIEQDEYNAIVL